MSNTFILIAIKAPGEGATIEPVYRDNVSRVVGGEVLAAPYAPGERDLCFVMSRERGFAGTVCVCTKRADGTFGGVPPARMVEAMARLDRAQW